MLTVWRRLHVEVDSMGGSGGVTLGPDDPQTADVATPDTSALDDAFAPAFIDVQILEGEPNNSNIPFRPAFPNFTEMDNYFLGPTGQRGTQNEDTFYWTAYVAGIYEILADGVRDNDPDDDPTNLSSRLGFYSGSQSEYSVIAMEVIRDVGIEHVWSADQIAHVQRAVVVHEIGHQFALVDDESGAYPSHIMRHPTTEAHDPLTPGITIEFLETHIAKIREHGRDPTRP